MLFARQSKLYLQNIRFQAMLGKQSHSSMAEPFKGKIPSIAEKEKRGKRVEIPKQEPYVQELTSNVELNIPTTN